MFVRYGIIRHGNVRMLPRRSAFRVPHCRLQLYQILVQLPGRKSSPCLPLARRDLCQSGAITAHQFFPRRFTASSHMTQCVQKSAAQRSFTCAAVPLSSGCACLPTGLFRSPSGRKMSFRHLPNFLDPLIVRFSRRPIRRENPRDTKETRLIGQQFQGLAAKWNDFCACFAVL